MWPYRAVKILLYILFTIGLIIIIGGIVLAVQSHHTPVLGLVKGQLRPCPNSPNCVSSETPIGDAEHSIAPFPIRTNQPLQHLAAAINQLGGTVIINDGHYLRATFTSRLFRYVDDVEAQVDAAHKQINWRSASRVGRSDLGVNRKRIEALRQRMQRQSN
ncbi:MAG: DUF1499 domain-containing protein [Mariprofundales bacterium]|nr:DUF1499 domain-containing protein [Mariprofundales bacterium]